MLFDQHQPVDAPAGDEVNMLPPPELNVSLPRSLFQNLRYLLLPQRLPPLQLTSRPINVGMLVGDILELPWYRTILSNIGDAISPETLPPLQLESQPVDVELISDQPAWWGSLLRNLADNVAPEKLPALRLSSGPADPNMASEVLVTPRWSSLIEGPKIFPSDRWKASFNRPADRPTPEAAPVRTILVHLPTLDAPATPDFYESERKLMRQLKRSVRNSRVREFVWLSVIFTEVTLLVVLRLLQH
jgi:hypothetical protein